MGLKPRSPHLSTALELGGGAVLRPLGRRDGPELLAEVEANRVRLRRWMPWVDGTRSSKDLGRFLADSETARRSASAARFAIVVEGRIAGVASLEAISRQHLSAHIGYWIAARCEGRGLVTAAAARLCQLGFETLGLHLVEIRAAPENRRSRAVPERLGFRFEGVLRERERLADRWVDHAVYSLLDSEWSRGAARRLL